LHVAVIAHLLVALVLPAVVRKSTRAAFAIAAIPPAGVLIWVLAQSREVLSGQLISETVAWAPLLGLEINFLLDPLALAMTVLVAGIGTLVLIYSIYYFRSGGGDARRSPPLLLAFAGAMLGLVFADNLLTVYIFWELTTVCSYLLIGQAGISRESRRSAIQALVITTLGGLVMLLGFIVLGESAGTYRISELAANPPSGATALGAAALILVGAFTKSAQVPFHSWLPAAMVAPTPISAYLHAASMVKAGVFLVARMAPVFQNVPQWQMTTVAFGVLTMLVGGWRALHEYDLKKVLAFGTVSQLGFLMALVGAGSRNAALAGVAMLLAHGFFKAALFMVVGIIDHQTGTRDIRELSGLGRQLPWLAGFAVLAAASMAGIPPTLGFVGKEAALSSFLGLGSAGLVVDLLLTVASMFTVAYSLRFLWGAFATKPGQDPSAAPRPGAAAMVPTAIPALAGLVLGLGYLPVDLLASSYADVLPNRQEEYHLALWHGFEMPLLLSALAILGGLGLHYIRRPLTAVRNRLPRLLDAQRGYERIMALLERVSVGVTARTQVGSLPVYIGIILLTVLAVPGTALLTQAGGLPEGVQLYHAELQIPLAIVLIVAAIAVARARRRLTAVLLTGVIGYAIGGLFVVDGGPDLALAQFLVETLTLVAFVFVLRRLPAHFSSAKGIRAFRLPKILLSGAVGVFIAASALVFSSARPIQTEVADPTPVPPASQEFIARAEEGAGATNVVNAIIVDFRAFDTVGEISVLAVALTGVASLILASQEERRIRSARAAARRQRQTSESEQRLEQQEEVRE